jgi:3',5'-cyclic-AMP phosphodiesterase
MGAGEGELEASMTNESVSPSSDDRAVPGVAGRLTLVHISDLHAGSPYFVANLMDRAIVEINEMQPHAVLVTGDLTEMGFRQEYLLAKSYLDRLECPRVLVIPGNHDSRNVGYVHFEELFGPRHNVYRGEGLTVVGVDSTEPDLDHGHIGRARYAWLEEQYEPPARLRVFMLHHHLLPVPGTGRERNVVYDAGDVLEVLQRCGVDLVLSGHKHVPYAWRLEDIFVVNTGTTCSLRLRGHIKPCYNLIEIGEDEVRVRRKYPFHGTETILEFQPSTLRYVKSIIGVREASP